MKIAGFWKSSPHIFNFHFNCSVFIQLLYFAEGGKIGHWIIRLYEAEPNGEPTQCNQYEYRCLNWLSNTVMPSWWLQWSIGPCPCNLQQV